MANAQSRRAFLTQALAGAASLAIPGRARAAGKRPPNVILMFSDDQGTIDINTFGAADLHTPNLDALAARGTRFTQFYVGAPVCSPSRAALMTGRYPQRAQLDNNAGELNGLPGAQVTLAEMFKGAGYRTGCFGKWHLGQLPEMVPTAQGFDEYFGHLHGCIDNYSHYFYWSGPNRHDLNRGTEEVWEEGNYFPGMVVREAHRFLEENKDKPFFMYLPFNIPHYPMHGEAEHRARYAQMEMPRRDYAALVSTLDEKVGEVVAKVDELGLREDTIIVFLSDHGHSVEERAFFGGGNAGPHRGHKFTLWEGGIRVPCILSWPGQIPEGAVREQRAVSMDLFPTLAHYCGIESLEHRIDGLNIADVIASEGADSPHSTMYWQLRDQWAVRDGDWKLVVNGPASEVHGQEIPAEKIFLSNLAEDLGESKNLAGAHPDVVAHLTQLHEAWAADVVLQ